MRLLLAALILFAQQAAAGVLVVGDSISAQKKSWTTYYRQLSGENLMVMAQNGRTIRDFTFPNDLHADGNIHTVFYFLGANDAIFYNTPDNLVAERVLTHLRFLKDRGFRVIVIQVPEFSFQVLSVRRLNAIILKKAKGLRLEVINLMPVWDTGLTTDTVHPKPKLSKIIAEYIYGN